MQVVKTWCIQIQEAYLIPNRKDDSRKCPWHATDKTLEEEIKEGVIKVTKDKKSGQDKVRFIRITVGFIQ